MNPNFKTGGKYSRDEIKAALGLPPSRGGDWDTGYHRHGNMVFVFAHVGTAGRTGHDYGNRWLTDGTFEWFGKPQSKPGQPLIEFMVGETSTVPLFTREHDRDKFTYHGQVRAGHVANQSPVRALWKRLPE